MESLINALSEELCDYNSKKKHLHSLISDFIVSII